MPLPKDVTPRGYQIELFHMIRDAFKTNRAVLAECATGSGKSVIMALIVDSFENLSKKWKLDRHLYFLVDENFLLDQFSSHLEKWEISHDLVTSGKKEGRPVNIHVCTVQSLRRRPPKNKSALFIVDEAHFSTSQSYMDLFNNNPDSKILGLTASPETGSGKGLAADWVKDDNGNSENAGNGIFDVLIESPVTMKDLTEQGYLCFIRYFGVPMRGIETLHMNCGDYKPDEVAKLLKEKGTFGDAVKEMQKFPEIKSHILFFCKSVSACYEMQTILFSHGYTAEVLEGKLTKKMRKSVMSNFSTGKTQILITCRMVLKGVDLPYLLMAVDIAPTPSRGTQRQKVGRIARVFEGKKAGIYLDMVGNHRVFPSSDIYAPIEWNFNSAKYNKKPTEGNQDNYCPLCFAYIPEGQTKCPECGAEKQITPKKPKKEKHLDGDLVEIKAVPLSEREEEEKAVIQNAINKALQDNDIMALYNIALTLTTKKKAPFYVYHKMNDKRNIINIPLLYRLQRSLQYKSGWVYWAKSQIRI